MWLFGGHCPVELDRVEIEAAEPGEGSKCDERLGEDAGVME